MLALPVVGDEPTPFLFAATRLRLSEGGSVHPCQGGSAISTHGRCFGQCWAIGASISAHGRKLRGVSGAGGVGRVHGWKLAVARPDPRRPGDLADSSAGLLPGGTICAAPDRPGGGLRDRGRLQRVSAQPFGGLSTRRPDLAQFGIAICAATTGIVALLATRLLRA